MNGKTVDVPPIGVEVFAECVPVYEEYPGWQSNTVGAIEYNDLPANAIYQKVNCVATLNAWA